MRVADRVAGLSAVLAALCVLAPPGEAAGVQIDDAPRQIYDVDATRILFKKSDTQFGVKDRAAQQVTTIDAPAPRHVGSGRLTPHGELLETHYSSKPFRQLDELYDGVRTTLGSVIAFEV